MFDYFIEKLPYTIFAVAFMGVIISIGLGMSSKLPSREGNSKEERTMTKLEQIKKAFDRHTESMLYFEERNDPKTVEANLWSFYRTVEHIVYPRHLPKGKYNDADRLSIKKPIKEVN